MRALWAVALLLLAGCTSPDAGDDADDASGEDDLPYDPSLFECPAGPSGSLFREEGAERGLTEIVDYAGNSPVHAMHALIGPIALGDLDNDRDVDIFVGDGHGSALYINNGAGQFTEMALDLGLDLGEAPDAYTPRAAVFFDADNDGFQELLMGGFELPLRMWSYDGERLHEVTEVAGLGQLTVIQDLAAADIDEDGDTDLFVVNYGDWNTVSYDFFADSNNGLRNFLILNNGDGTFTRQVGNDVADTVWGLTDTRWSFGGAFGDYDDDGDQDLYVSNDFGGDILYRNDGDRFTDVSEEAGIESWGNGMGIVWADLDSDADFDAYTSNIYVPGTGVPTMLGNNLFINDAGTFTDEAMAAGVDDALWAWGSTAGDFDNDGHIDIYVTNGFQAMPDFGSFYRDTTTIVEGVEGAEKPLNAYGGDVRYNQTHLLVFTTDPNASFREGTDELQPARGFHNDGDGTFTDRADDWGAELHSDGRAVASVDIDGDGRLDLLVTSWLTVPCLFHNVGEGGSSISFWLEGTDSNRDGIGARITVTSEARSYIAERAAGMGFMSQASPVVHLGLGDETMVDVEVRWPSGHIDAFQDVEANRVYSLQEGGDLMAA